MFALSIKKNTKWHHKMYEYLLPEVSSDEADVYIYFTFCSREIHDNHNVNPRHQIDPHSIDIFRMKRSIKEH
jgi:hypothetical protein